MSTTQPRLPTTFEVRGTQIPSVGLGTFQSESGNELVKNAVRTALQCGYKHIDTAAAYGNERQVGEAIKESGIPRHEIFVTTKLPQTCHKPPDVERSMDRSLEALQLDYCDLYLMHFPHAVAADPDYNTLRHPDGKPIIDNKLSRAYPQTWQAMEKLVDKGKAKLIGVSNFNILKTKRILEIARIRPAVNQIELHPYLPQHDILHFCAQEGIHVCAHQPLGGKPVAVVCPNRDIPGPLFDADISEIASAYRKTPAQILLSWAVQRGTSVVPKSVQECRMIENKDLIELSDEHTSRIDCLAQEKGAVRYLDPTEYLGFDVFNEDADEPVGGGR